MEISPDGYWETKSPLSEWEYVKGYVAFTHIPKKIYAYLQEYPGEIWVDDCSISYRWVND